MAVLLYARHDGQAAIATSKTLCTVSEEVEETYDIWVTSNLAIFLTCRPLKGEPEYTGAHSQAVDCVTSTSVTSRPSQRRGSDDIIARPAIPLAALVQPVFRYAALAPGCRNCQIPI